MEKQLTGKIPRSRIGMLELPRLPADVLTMYRNNQGQTTFYRLYNLQLTIS